MSGTTNGNADRLRMNLVEVVRSDFGFLGQEFGFQEAQSQPTMVRFEKDNLVAIVYHGRKSYELGFDAGRDDEQYSMSELIRASDPEAAVRYRNFVAMTPSDVQTGMKLLAALVKQHATRALRGDDSFFDELRQQRASWSEATALGSKARQVRPQAEQAFREGRYREAAELWAKVEDQLTPLERRKLKFAREQRKPKPGA